VNHTLGAAKLQAWRTPKVIELHYPLQIGNVGDWASWLRVMTLDFRLSDRDKLIVVRLALHLNLKNGRCDPSLGLLALECSIPGNVEAAERAVRKSIARAEKAGWLVRTYRHGGASFNRTNKYSFGYPPEVWGWLKEDKSRPDPGVLPYGLPTGQIEGGRPDPGVLQNYKGNNKKNAAPDGAASEETDLFRRGKQVLGNKSGGLIAELLRAKQGSIAEARAAIELASTKHDAREYVGAIIRGRNPGQVYGVDAW
jgi:hypothetical protein